MSRVYLSGPISRPTKEEAMRRFALAEQKWRERGFTVFNPMNNGLSYETTWIRQMAVDLYQLECCDTVFMLDGWQESNGALMELHCALTRNARIYFQTLPDKNLMVHLVKAANEMRGALLIDEQLMFDAEWYAEQCINNGYFQQP